MKHVFVSSTFRDMQFERDALNTEVVPRLNAFLEKYAENVHFGDLRWGVNTTDLESEESSRKVLRVCLDEIESSKPYMIVFIGERYGWIPERTLIEEAARLKDIDPETLESDISVTNLEIEYGALLDPDLEGRVLFYFRNPFDKSKMTPEERAGYESESPLHAEKIEKLKEKIKEKYPDFIRFYDVKYDSETHRLTGLEPLMDTVYSDLVRIFDIDLEYYNSIPCEKRALMNSDAYFEKLARDSYFRAQSRVEDFNFDIEKPICQMRYCDAPTFELISGKSGSGVKTLLAQKYLSAKKDKKYAIAYAYGFDSFTKARENFTASLIYGVENFLGKAHSLSNSERALFEILSEFTEKKRGEELHVFIMSAPKSMMSFFHRLEAAFPDLFGVAFHVCFKYSFKKPLPMPFCERSTHTEVGPLLDDEKDELVKAILKARRKELGSPVIKEMLKCKSAESPLYLSLLTERLLMLDSDDFLKIRELGDGMDNINKYMIGIVKNSGESVEDIAEELLRELCQRIDPEVISRLISHLLLRYHFNEQGIREYFAHYKMSFSALSYTLFKKAVPSLLNESSDGFLFFSNEDIKNGAKKLLNTLGIDDDTDRVIDYLKTLSEKQSRKALPIMLYSKGDAGALLDFCLKVIDIPLKDISSQKELFGEYGDRLSKLLFESLCENTGFCTKFIGELLIRLKEKKLTNPYTVINTVTSFLEVDPDDTDMVNAAVREAVKLIDMINRINAERESEELCVFEYILREFFVAPFLDRYTDEDSEDIRLGYMKYSQSFAPTVKNFCISLIKKGYLSFNPYEDLLSGTFLISYKAVKHSDDPINSPPFAFMENTCKYLEMTACNASPDYFEALIRGDRSVSDRIGKILTQVLWLPINAYRYGLRGDEEKREMCFMAFLSLHRIYFSHGFSHSYHVGDYLGMLCELCSFLAEKNDKENFLEIFNWSREILASHYNNRACAESVMNMHLVGLNSNFVSDELSCFSQIFAILMHNAYEILDADLIFDAVKYLFINSYRFTDGELFDKFCQFVGRGLSGIKNSGFLDGDDIFSLLGVLVGEYADSTDSDLMDLTGEVMLKLASEGIFTKDEVLGGFESVYLSAKSYLS